MKGLSGVEARRRLSEVLLVATTDSRGLVGVSSAYVQHNPQLRMDLWYYRAFVARAHRKSNVASRFIGENQRGDHVRVRYFPGALAPPLL